MLKNRAFYIASFALTALLFVFPFLNAETGTATLSEFNTSMIALNSVADEITNKKITLSQFFTIRTNLKTKLEENFEDSRHNILESMTSLESAITALGEEILDTMEGEKLKKSFDSVNVSIEKFIRTKIDVGIFQRQGNDQGVVVGYNQAYANYKADYDGLSREDRKTANKRWFNTDSYEKIYVPKLKVPKPETVFVSRCPNPSGRCYGYYENVYEHKEICPKKHGVDGTTNKVWWSCFDSSCTHSAQHWVPCRGNCGDLLPPPTISRLPGMRGDTIWRITTYHDHEERCQVEVYKNFIVGRQPCGRKYFTCGVGCKHGVKEGFFDNSTSFSAYGTYRAEVVYNDPIREVYWYFQKPGGSMKQVPHDTSGGKTSSWSHTFDSTSGTYKVKSTVYFKGSRPKITHERNVYVY